jgi:hypothetical protein
VYMCPNLPLLHPHQSCSGLRSFLKVVDVPRHEVYTSEVVGGMGGLGPGRSGGSTGTFSGCREAAQPGRNLQARVKPTDCSQLVSARTFPAPARNVRNPCNCAHIHTHIRPARPPSEHAISARNMASTCTLRTLFTYALAGRPRSNAIDCELRENMANKLAGRAEGG